MRLKAREQCRGRLHRGASSPGAGQRMGSRCWGTRPCPKAQERLQQQQDGVAQMLRGCVHTSRALPALSVLQSVLFPEETLRVAALPPEKGKGPILNISQPQHLTSRGCTKHTWGWESKPDTCLVLQKALHRTTVSQGSRRSHSPAHWLPFPPLPWGVPAECA